MNFKLLVLPAGALAAAALLLTPAESEGFSLIGGSLSQSQRDFRVFDNFTDNSANNNTTPDPQWPGYTGAELAIWKGCMEWSSRVHGSTGSGDPAQSAVGGSGANFDPTFQGNANGVGTSNNNIHSEISGSSGSTLAFAETPISDGWRIRYYQTWQWQDGPDAPGSGQDLQGIACHEYGHALGLGHSTDNQATMYFAASGTGVNGRSIESDDVAGVQFIYGTVDENVKPVIAGVIVQGSQVTVTGRNFANNSNELWFTQGGSGGNGQAVKVTGLSSSSSNSVIVANIPGAAGPGDILVRKGGNSGFSGLSNPWPIDTGLQSPEATSLNIDLGISEKVPGTGQGGAAGNTGAWNGIDIPVGTAALVDPSFASTQGTLGHTGSNGEIVFDEPASTGFFAKLFDDGHDVGCNNNDSVTYTFDGFAAGTYDVYVYSWVLEDTSSLTDITVNGGAKGTQACGGIAYQANLIDGGNYVVDQVTITSGQSITVTAEQNQGCARVNGFQIVEGTACGLSTNYCTAGVSSSGCQPTMSSTGIPSASASSGFNLVANNVEGAKDGLFFYGTNGQQANPWGNGSSFQCVVPPVFRGGLLIASGTSNACDGSFSQDLNALWASNPAKNPGVGADVNAQLWYRDPQNTSNQTTSLSDGLNFTVCP